MTLAALATEIDAWEKSGATWEVTRMAALIEALLYHEDIQRRVIADNNHLIANLHSDVENRTVQLEVARAAMLPPAERAAD